MTDILSRRQVLALTGASVATAIAGCSSGSGEDGSDGPLLDSPTPTPPDGATPTSQPTATQTATQTQETDRVGEDYAYTGEQVVEQHLNDKGVYWIELEHTSEQMADTSHASFLSNLAQSFDFQTETVSHSGETFDVDAAYFTLDPDHGPTPAEPDEMGIRLGYLDAGKWQDGEGFDGNQFRAVAFAGAGSVGDEALRTLFSQDVLGYDDVSDDFPDEYLSLIDGG